MPVPALHSYLCLQSPGLFSYATHTLQSPALLSYATHTLQSPAMPHTLFKAQLCSAMPHPPFKAQLGSAMSHANSFSPSTAFLTLPSKPSSDQTPNSIFAREETFSTAFFNSDIQLSVYTCSCFISVCRFVNRPIIHTLFCLVDIKKRSLLTSCVF